MGDDEVSMGDDTICHSGLISEDRAKHIISFGEDKSGKNCVDMNSYVTLNSTMPFRMSFCIQNIHTCTRVCVNSILLQFL